MPRHLHSIRLDPDLVAAIDAAADLEGRTRSDMIRRLLREALDERAGHRFAFLDMDE